MYLHILNCKSFVISEDYLTWKKNWMPSTRHRSGWGRTRRALHPSLTQIFFPPSSPVPSSARPPPLRATGHLTNSPTSRRAGGDRPKIFPKVFAARLRPAPIKSLTTLPPIRRGSNPAGSGHGGGEDSAVDALVGLRQPRLGG